MPRIDHRDPADPAIAELADTIRRRCSTGRLLNLERMLLQSPPFAHGWNVNGRRHPQRAAGAAAGQRAGGLRRRAPQRRRLRMDPARARVPVAAGGCQEQLDAPGDVTAACCDEARFDEVERAALRLTLDMTREVRVRSLLGERQHVELVGTIAGYNMVSRFLVVLGIDAAGE